MPDPGFDVRLLCEDVPQTSFLQGLLHEMGLGFRDITSAPLAQDRGCSEQRVREQLATELKKHRGEAVMEVDGVQGSEKFTWLAG